MKKEFKCEKCGKKEIQKVPHQNICSKCEDKLLKEIKEA